MNKLKSVMGFTVQPEVSAYWICTTVICKTVYDADGTRHTIKEEDECYGPSYCSYHACNCN